MVTIGLSPDVSTLFIGEASCVDAGSLLVAGAVELAAPSLLILFLLPHPEISSRIAVSVTSEMTKRFFVPNNLKSSSSSFTFRIISFDGSGIHPKRAKLVEIISIAGVIAVKWKEKITEKRGINRRKTPYAGGIQT
jgi:hypothetical protein